MENAFNDNNAKTGM